MIELPEAAVLSEQVSSVLRGKCIVGALANHTPHKFAWFSGDPAAYGEMLPGKTIRRAAACGNHVEIYADDMLLVINTPMRYHAPGEAPPKKHQLLLDFEDGSTLSCTVQMWGGLFCFPSGAPGGMEDYRIAKQKPSPLSAAFDRGYFASLRQGETGRLSAKEFLATKQRIPGLGNGVLQDILWTARIHPKRRLETIDEDGFEAMFQAVRGVLHAMTAAGGRDTERDLFGCPGGYKTILSKFTAGRPCPQCGETIRKAFFMGGSIYFCAACQPQVGA